MWLDRACLHAFWVLLMQRTRLDEATELLLEKLLNSARDADSKVRILYLKHGILVGLH